MQFLSYFKIDVKSDHLKLALQKAGASAPFSQDIKKF